jgi:predicted RNase H-like nuclease (RuvC/YqgF family)
MKLEELKTLFEKHTTDEEINFDELNKAINASFDAVIQKKEEAAKKSVISEYKAAGAAELLKKYEFDNEDSFGAYVTNAKQGETELSQKANRLETEKQTLQSKIAQLEGSVGTLTTEKAQLARLNQTVTSGTVRPEFAEFVVDKVSKSLEEGDEFSEKLTAYIEANPQYGTTETRKDIGQQAGGRSSGDVNPWAKETRNIAEQTRIYRENPAKARELAKQAGVKI